jgi:hypothetical protein
LPQADYAWLTRELIASGSGSHTPGGLRVVSLLEGGYSLAPLQPDTVPGEKRARGGAVADKKSAAAAAGAAAAGAAALAPGDAAAAAMQAAAAQAAAEATGAATAAEGVAAAAAAAQAQAQAVGVGDFRSSDGGLVRGVLAHVRALAEAD